LGAEHLERDLAVQEALARPVDVAKGARGEALGDLVAIADDGAAELRVVLDRGHPPSPAKHSTCQIEQCARWRSRGGIAGPSARDEKESAAAVRAGASKNAAGEAALPAPVAEPSGGL